MLRPAFVDDNLIALDALAANTTGRMLDRGRLRRPLGTGDPQRRGARRRRAGRRSLPQDQAPELRRVRRGTDVHARRRGLPRAARRLRARPVGLRGRVDARPALRRVRAPAHAGDPQYQRLAVPPGQGRRTHRDLQGASARDRLVDRLRERGRRPGRAGVRRRERGRPPGRVARSPRGDVRRGPARRRHRRRDLQRAGTPAVARGSRAGLPRSGARAAGLRAQERVRAGRARPVGWDRLGARRGPRQGRARPRGRPHARDALPLLVAREPRGRDAGGHRPRRPARRPRDRGRVRRLPGRCCGNPSGGPRPGSPRRTCRRGSGATC